MLIFYYIHITIEALCDSIYETQSSCVLYYHIRLQQLYVCSKIFNISVQLYCVLYCHIRLQQLYVCSKIFNVSAQHAMITFIWWSITVMNISCRFFSRYNCRVLCGQAVVNSSETDVFILASTWQWQI